MICLALLLVTGVLAYYIWQAWSNWELRKVEFCRVALVGDARDGLPVSVTLSANQAEQLQARWEKMQRKQSAALPDGAGGASAAGPSVAPPIVVTSNFNSTHLVIAVWALALVSLINVLVQVL